MATKMKLPCTVLEVRTETEDRSGKPLQYPRHQAVVEASDDRKYIDLMKEDIPLLEAQIGKQVELPVMMSPWQKTINNQIKSGVNFRFQSPPK